MPYDKSCYKYDPAFEVFTQQGGLTKWSSDGDVTIWKQQLEMRWTSKQSQ